jgi:hypothetical protein
VQYFFASGNEQRGPYTLAELSALGLRPDTLVWREGMSHWQRADTFAELTALLPEASLDSGQRDAPALAPHACVAAPQLAYASGAQRPTNPLAVASLVLGIISIPAMCIYAIGTPCAILAVVFGAIARGKAKRGDAGGEGMAMAGLLCGCVSLGLLIVAVIVFLVIAGIWAF